MTVDEFIAEWESESPFITAHTSGSTGAPKEVRLPKSLVKASALRTIDFFGLDSDSHLHLPLSPDYIAGKMMIVRALLSGASLTYEAPSNHLSGLADIPSVDLLAVVPSQLEWLLADISRLHNTRNIIVGGSPLTTLLTERCAEINHDKNSAIRIVETYGMTETASHIALRDVGDHYFHPLNGVKVRLSDEETLIATLDGFGQFRTNDLAEMQNDGSFRITGRADDAIITGAMKVHPAKLEATLDPIITKCFPNASRTAVSSRPDRKWVNEIVLAIDSRPTEEEKKGFLAAAAAILPPHEIPRDVIFIPDWPLTSSGKTRRNQLREYIAEIIR